MSVRSMIRCAIFAGLMTVCAWVAVPVGAAAVTLQTLALFVALGVLGGRWGCVSILVYLALGAVGLPVFSGLQGGLGILLGPTGGYLWGFLLGGLGFWLVEKKLPLWAAMVLCQLICYATGTVWFYFAYAGTGLWAILLQSVAPFLLPDALKLILSIPLTQRLKKYSPK